MRQTTGRVKQGTRTRKPPSRARYEESHPTVSGRVPREIYERLQSARNKEGMSFADILKVGLGALEVKQAKEDEVRRAGYQDGYKKGRVEAERHFKVTYRCNVCGKSVTIDTPDEKETIRRYMQDQGWGHGECHERRRKGTRN